MKHIILGSQSPQRFNLLRSVVSDERLVVLPPVDNSELGFEDCETDQAIERRLRQIVDSKLTDVGRQVGDSQNSPADACVVCADTVVVATDGFDQPLVLGKPPAENWRVAVKEWFENYYSGRNHDVWTCFGIVVNGQTDLQIVKTTVAFPVIDNWWIDWYLETEEPVGKAGGYGIQGHAASLVDSITGSLTNVIGLPMFEVTTALRKYGVLSDATESPS